MLFRSPQEVPLGVWGCPLVVSEASLGGPLGSRGDPLGSRGDPEWLPWGPGVGSAFRESSGTIETEPKIGKGQRLRAIEPAMNLISTSLSIYLSIYLAPLSPHSLPPLPSCPALDFYFLEIDLFVLSIYTLRGLICLGLLANFIPG